MNTKWTVADPKFEADLINQQLAVSPWVGHRYFAYDLICSLRPQRIVELGTHYGCSFFAFAQAIKDSTLSTELYGVDTWHGDPHAGYYDESVYTVVERTIENHFQSKNFHLVRKLFDDAVSDFSEDSIDILHIDGLHTYDAVRHDFETWLPKLRSGGLVLFHDVALSTGYGSADFWIEVSGQYPSFMFTHSWGLGVLFPKGETLLGRLKKWKVPQRVDFYRYKSELELAHRQLRDQAIMLEERVSVMTSMDEMISQRDSEINSLAQRIKDLTDSLVKMEGRLEDFRRATQAQAKMIDDRDNAISNMDEMIRVRDNTINELTKPLWQKVLSQFNKFAARHLVKNASDTPKPQEK